MPHPLPTKVFLQLNLDMTHSFSPCGRTHQLPLSCPFSSPKDIDRSESEGLTLEPCNVGVEILLRFTVTKSYFLV